MIRPGWRLEVERKALRDHHERYNLSLPVSPATLRSGTRAFSRYSARPLSPQVAPVSAAQLRELLLLYHNSPVQFQDALVTVFCTVTASHPSDLVNIDVCDILLQFASDPPCTTAIHIWGAMPDVFLKGHFPRIGRPRDPCVNVLKARCKTGLEKY